MKVNNNFKVDLTPEDINQALISYVEDNWEFPLPPNQEFTVTFYDTYPEEEVEVGYATVEIEIELPKRLV